MKCPECDTLGYLVLPSYGQIHTEDCKKLHKKLKGDGLTAPLCKCPVCQTCFKIRMEYLEFAFDKNNPRKRERDSTQQETREQSTGLSSSGRTKDNLL
jgi:hypothetical protein